jgi:hypothetical protein
MRKRTRQQKIKAAQRRAHLSVPVAQATVVSNPSVQALADKVVISKIVTNKTTPAQMPIQNQIETVRHSYAQELFHFDTRLIYGDLRKTLVLVVGIFIFLGLIARFGLGR